MLCVGSNGCKKELIVHLQVWLWTDIIARLRDIKDAGWTAIQISPVNKCKPIWSDNGRIVPLSNEWWDIMEKEWWTLYQPTYFEIGNPMGTKEDLKRLCDEADKLGIKIVPDLVDRHVANSPHNELEPFCEVDDRIKSRPEFFLEKKNITNNKDRWQEIWRCTNLPGLNYNCIELVEEYLLPNIREIANYTDSFRLDQMKHFALRDEGGTFLDKLVSCFGSTGIHYGECIFGNPDIMTKYYDQYKIMPLVNDYELFGYPHRVAFFASHDTEKSLMTSTWMNDQVRIEKWKNLLTQTDYALYYARRLDETIFSDEIKKINWSYK